jgi:hypothetical protein
MRGLFGELRVLLIEAPGATFDAGRINPTHRSSCEALRATALSLSHLTWSLDTSTAIRTCHPTTSFPV